MRATSIATLALVQAALVVGHSWIDSLQQIDASGNPTGPVGFIRGYQGHLDAVSTHGILSLRPDGVLCAPSQQSAQSYSAKFPMLTLPAGASTGAGAGAGAGAAFVATYTENGHVTKDTLPPNNGPRPGNYSWFMAAAPGVQLKTLADLVDGAKATVVARGNYDDGTCAEDATKGRSPQPCRSIVRLPAGIAQNGDVRQIVWLWNFPKVDGQVEMYTSCADIAFSNGAGAQAGQPQGQPTNAQAAGAVPATAPVPAAVPAAAAAAAAAAKATTTLRAEVRQQQAEPSPATGVSTRAQLNPLVDAGAVRL